MNRIEVAGELRELEPDLGAELPSRELPGVDRNPGTIVFALGRLVPAPERDDPVDVRDDRFGVSRGEVIARWWITARRPLSSMSRSCTLSSYGSPSGRGAFIWRRLPPLRTR